jgi:hypothetical protein
MHDRLIDDRGQLMVVRLQGFDIRASLLQKLGQLNCQIPKVIYG